MLSIVLPSADRLGLTAKVLEPTGMSAVSHRRVAASPSTASPTIGVWPVESPAASSFRCDTSPGREEPISDFTALSTPKKKGDLK